MVFFRKIAAAAALALAAHLAPAEMVTSDAFGYSLDVPEGFDILDMTEDQSMVQLTQRNFPATILLCVYPDSRCKSAPDALSLALGKLGAEPAGKGAGEVRWRRLNCAASEFSMDDVSGAFGGERQRGWGAAFPLALKKSFLVALAFLPERSWAEGSCVCESAVDSVSVDAGGLREPGILTARAFPRKGRLAVEMSVDGERVPTEVDGNDSAANRAVIDREFALFSLYARANFPEAIPAWQRFYRMIMRDSLGRLRRVSFDVSAALTERAAAADPENPNAAVAASLLKWAQGLRYRRESASADRADFADVVSVIKDEGSDCDSRSLLVAVILKNMGVDSCFFVSAAYSHALLGVSLPGKKGVSFDVDGVRYLVGDTTAKGATLGMVAASQADRSKWLEVEFPF